MSDMIKDSLEVIQACPEKGLCFSSVCFDPDRVFFIDIFGCFVTPTKRQSPPTTALRAYLCLSGAFLHVEAATLQSLKHGFDLPSLQISAMAVSSRANDSHQLFSLSGTCKINHLTPTFRGFCIAILSPIPNENILRTGSSHLMFIGNKRVYRYTDTDGQSWEIRYFIHRLPLNSLSASNLCMGCSGNIFINGFSRSIRS